MWTPCHVLFASSHIWAFAPWCASSVSLTRPRNACCRYFDIWRQRCRPLFKYQQRYWPCFRYQRRYRNKCKHKIHGDLRFGEEEDATSRTYLKKMFAKTNFYHTLDLKHSPPCWYVVTRRSSFQCSRLVSRYCYQQQHHQIPRVLSTTIPIRNCSR